MPDSDQTVVIIAGRNGAGKTTFARAFLAQSGMRFINANLIAAGLSPFVNRRAIFRRVKVEIFAFSICCSGRKRITGIAL